MKTEYIIIGCLFGGILIFYFLVIQSRRIRYSQIAKYLQAKYISQGIFKTGKITGTINERRFQVENTIGWVHSEISKFVTNISVDCNNKGIPLIVESKFFKDFPNWKAVFTLGENSHFETGPLQEKYKPQVHNIFQEINTTYDNCIGIRKGFFKIDKSVIEFAVPGILKNHETIKHILKILCSISQDIETSPVIG